MLVDTAAVACLWSPLEAHSPETTLRSAYISGVHTVCSLGATVDGRRAALAAGLCALWYSQRLTHESIPAAAFGPAMHAVMLHAARRKVSSLCHAHNNRHNTFFFLFFSFYTRRQLANNGLAGRAVPPAYTQLKCTCTCARPSYTRLQKHYKLDPHQDPLGGY